MSANHNTSPEFWATVRSIFDEVCESSHDERTRLLSERDLSPEVHQAVADLLAGHDNSTNFLTEPKPTRAKLNQIPTRAKIDRYLIIREVGRGGMGTVYEAVQDNPERTVALKVFHAFSATQTAMSRFEREAMLLARLDHPNIAKVYDAGTYTGELSTVPYFTMEYITGSTPITKHVEDQNLSITQRVELFLSVCDAIHSGHLRGIIHRDLKPDNILVGEDGRAKVIDFGVASVSDNAIGVDTIATEGSDLIGTLRYMSPEQLMGEVDRVDTRCDVYSLGVVLFEMIAGETPHKADSSSVYDFVNRIEQAPPPVIKSIRGSDLEAVIGKALQRDPAHRYQTAHEFAQDLKRFLENKPVEAKRDRAWYIARKAIQRHRWPAAIAISFIATVIVSTAALGLLYTRASKIANELRITTYLQSINLASHALNRSQTDELHHLLDACPPELRGWEWRHFKSRADDSLTTINAPSSVGVALSADGTLYAHAAKDGFVRVWNTADQSLVDEIQTNSTYAETMSFSPNNRYLAVGTRANQPSFVVDLVERAVSAVIPVDEFVKCVLTLPDNQRYVTGSSRGVLSIRSLQTGAVLHTLGNGNSWITSLALSPDGDTLAVGRNNGTIETWDLSSLSCLFTQERAHTTRVSGLVYSSDSTRLFSSSWSSTLKTWDTTGRELDVRRIDADLIRNITITPDGTTLALATPTSIELRDAQTGKLQRRLLGHSNCLGVAFPELPWSSSTHLLYSWSADSFKTWDINHPTGAFTLGTHTSRADALALHQDDSWVASAGRTGSIVIHNLLTREELARWPSETPRVYRLSANDSGTHLAASCSDGLVRVWSVLDGVLQHAFEASTPAYALSYIDNDLLVMATRDHHLSAWSMKSDSQVWRTETLQYPITSIQLSPTKDRIAAGIADGTLRIWRFVNSSPVLQKTIQAHDRHIGVLAWSPDGNSIATGSNDNTIKVWDLETDEALLHLTKHTGLIKGLAFMPDGSRLVSTAWEGDIRIWDTIHGNSVLQLEGHAGPVMDVVFNERNEQIITAGFDGTVRVWEVTPQD